MIWDIFVFQRAVVHRWRFFRRRRDVRQEKFSYFDVGVTFFVVFRVFIEWSYVEKSFISYSVRWNQKQSHKEVYVRSEQYYHTIMNIYGVLSSLTDGCLYVYSWCESFRWKRKMFTRAAWGQKWVLLSVPIPHYPFHSSSPSWMLFLICFSFSN